MGMKDRCLSRFLLALLLVVVLVGTALVLVSRTAETFTTQEVTTLKLDEVKLLMKYHGATIARYQDGKWYFLSPRGRWLPLKTKAACRYLASVSPDFTDASCFF